MLRAKILPKILAQANTNGVKGALYVFNLPFLREGLLTRLSDF